MKVHLTLSLLLIGMTFLQSQDETIELDFVENEPIWRHVFSDTTFEEISGQPYWTKHSSLDFHIIERQGDHLYTLASSRTPRQFPDLYGFVLEKIDIHSGEVLWNHHNTQYNGGNQDFYKRIHFTDNGDVDLIGVEPYQMDDEGGNWGLGAYFSQSIRKVIGQEQGQILDAVLDTSIIYEVKLPAINFHQFSLFPDSLYLTATMELENSGPPGEPNYNYGPTYQLRNKNFDVIDSVRFQFDFENLDVFSIHQGPFMKRLNDNTIVALAYRDRYDSWENKGQQLMWIDISDPYNIKKKRLLDLKDLVPNSKESFFSLGFTCLNNTIFLSHRHPNFDLEKNAAYILWLTEEGEVKTFIDDPYYEDHLYQHTDIFFASENYAYLYAFPSYSGRMGYDIIKIEEGVDTIEYTSSITVTNPGVEFAITAYDVYEDGYVVFGGLVQGTGQKEKTSDQLFCFRAEDLGMDLEPTSSVDNRLGEELKVYPNPFFNRIMLECPNCKRDGYIRILTAAGIEVLSQKWTGSKMQMDLGSQPSGLYIIQFFDNDQNFLDAKRIIKGKSHY